MARHNTVRRIARHLCVWVLLIDAVVAAGCAQSQSTDPSRLRVGWQTTWATQGQIAQTMRHTNVLEKNGLSATFVGAAYGGPLNEAALADQVDVIFTADQPAIALVAHSPDWEIIGRLMYNRIALYVPPDSPVRTVADLKGKTIAVPFGAAAQRLALEAVQQAGLNPRQDVKLVNLDITGQAAIIERGTRASWGGIDAMAGFDPTAAAFQLAGSVRMLVTGQATALVVMSKRYIGAHPQAPVHFLTALMESIFYYRQHQQQANQWFRSASGLPYGDDVLTLSASVEPDITADTISDIDITLKPALISDLQQTADFMANWGLITHRVTVEDYVDATYAQTSRQTLLSSTYDPSTIKVIATTDG